MATTNGAKPKVDLRSTRAAERLDQQIESAVRRICTHDEKAKARRDSLVATRNAAIRKRYALGVDKARDDPRHTTMRQLAELVGLSRQGVLIILRDDG